jgi:hypothetical protein
LASFSAPGDARRRPARLESLRGGAGALDMGVPQRERIGIARRDRERVDERGRVVRFRGAAAAPGGGAEAIALYRGPLLQDFPLRPRDPFGEWIAPRAMISFPIK